MRHGKMNVQKTKTFVTLQEWVSDLLFSCKEKVPVGFLQFFKGKSTFENIERMEDLNMQSLLIFRKFDLESLSFEEEGLSQEMVDYARMLQTVGLVYQFYKFSYKSRFPVANAINTSDYKFVLQEKIQPIVQETLYQVRCENGDDAKEEPRMESIDVIQLIHEEQGIIKDQQANITSRFNKSLRQTNKSWAFLVMSISVSIAAVIFISVVSVGFSVMNIPLTPSIIGGSLIALVGFLLVGLNTRKSYMAGKEYSHSECCRQDHAQADRALTELHSFWRRIESCEMDDAKLNKQEFVTAPNAPQI